MQLCGRRRESPQMNWLMPRTPRKWWLLYKGSLVYKGQSGLTERQLFDAVGTGTSNFLMLHLLIGQMVERGLLVVIGQDPKYNDLIYGLSAQAA